MQEQNPPSSISARILANFFAASITPSPLVAVSAPQNGALAARRCELHIFGDVAWLPSRVTY